MKSISLLILSVIALSLAACTKANEQVVLQSISFSDKTKTLLRGQQEKLAPVFIPKTFEGIVVNWTTSDAAVAFVTPEGRVNANGVGEAVITIKDKNSATSGKITIIVK